MRNLLLSSLLFSLLFSSLLIPSVSSSSPPLPLPSLPLFLPLPLQYFGRSFLYFYLLTGENVIPTDQTNNFVSEQLTAGAGHILTEKCKKREKDRDTDRDRANEKERKRIQRKTE